MAKGFECGACGWSEQLHKALGDFPAEDRPLLLQIKEGFSCSFEDCTGYFVTKEEADAIEAEEERGGAHEGQH
jgi:hypothetical protein